MQLFGQIAGKEFASCRNTDLLSSSRRSIRRVDAKDGNSGADIVLQQIAIVACEFHNEAIAAEITARNDIKHVVTRMPQERG
jgi:hypothetical protein